MQTKKPYVANEYFPDHLSGAQPKKSRWNLWIIVISVAFFLFIIYSKYDRISEFIFGNSTITVVSWANLEIGQQVSIEWEIKQDGDFVTHTHKLYTLNSWIFGLKSKIVNLNQYSWMVGIEWMVSENRDGLYIIDVSSLIDQNTWTNQVVATWTDLSWQVVSQWVYVPKAWVFFPVSFFDEYVIENTGDNSKITVKNLQTNQAITISYFTCKKWNPNEDCTQLTSSFSSTSETSFTTSNWDTFYKLDGVNSWYFANDNLFGYFINDVSEQEVINLSKYITLPNKTYVNDTIIPLVSMLCKDGNVSMESVTSQSIVLENKVLVLKLNWKIASWTADCKLTIDPTLPEYAQKTAFTYKEVAAPAVVTWLDSTPATTPTPTTPAAWWVSLTADWSVKQFALTLDKTLEFTSSRGHTIVFPSRKISYESVSIWSDLWIKWINCTVQTNVIAYVNKDLIKESPTAKIYECRVKAGLEIPSTYRSIPLDDGRTFIIEAIDPSWVDFANNVQVRLNN